MCSVQGGQRTVRTHLQIATIYKSVTTVAPYWSIGGNCPIACIIVDLHTGVQLFSIGNTVVPRAKLTGAISLNAITYSITYEME